MPAEERDQAIRQGLQQGSYSYIYIHYQCAISHGTCMKCGDKCSAPMYVIIVVIIMISDEDATSVDPEDPELVCTMSVGVTC